MNILNINPTDLKLLIPLLYLSVKFYINNKKHFFISLIKLFVLFPLIFLFFYMAPYKRNFIFGFFYAFEFALLVDFLLVIASNYKGKGKK